MKSILLLSAMLASSLNMSAQSNYTYDQNPYDDVYSQERRVTPYAPDPYYDHTYYDHNYRPEPDYKETRHMRWSIPRPTVHVTPIIVGPRVNRYCVVPPTICRPPVVVYQRPYQIYWPHRFAHHRQFIDYRGCR